MNKNNPNPQLNYHSALEIKDALKKYSRETDDLIRAIVANMPRDLSRISTKKIIRNNSDNYKFVYDLICAEIGLEDTEKIFGKHEKIIKDT